MKNRYWDQPPSDFTVYFEKDKLAFLLKGEHQQNKALCSDSDETTDASQIRSFDKTVSFAWPLNLLPPNTFSDDSSELGDNERRVVIYRARSLICLCFNRRFFSATLRLDDETPPLFGVCRNADHNDIRAAVMQAEPREFGKNWLFVNSASPVDHEPFLGIIEPTNVLQGEWVYPAHRIISPERHENENPYLFTDADLTNVLFPAIFTPELELTFSDAERVIRQGLVVISGQTGTSKSIILRGLLIKYLEHFNYGAWGKRRYPHILTIEDPIERPMIAFDPGSLKSFLNHGPLKSVNFTPRQIKDDVRSLADGLHEALRQTPTAVLVGETRDRKDWKHLLEFAATGHLCLTTTHAGSLVETMRTIIEATKSTTPDLRSSLAEKVIAVVHLRAFDLAQKTPGDSTSASPELGSSRTMILPALWRNVHGGANFFVSDGLTAILPRRAEGRGGRPAAGCRGRSDFASDLLRRSEISNAVRGHVSRIALKADLEGV